ncbi:ABC transporter permease [Sphaerisporangium sp. TRM90804]|uniref:ABC transporter permease n=1 Tax=Sphaerisporangium sp. TRM90804 TaxID=3031113 RepID=UPI002446B1C2|nr:ABC transporter permease [Sphaerisporangium sp. TRM90804]MDH2429197.1 ABC transporter permease [Sphaerisporangium sp. TRM90804]
MSGAAGFAPAVAVAEGGPVNLVRQSALLAGRNLRVSLGAAAVAGMVITPLLFFFGFLAVFRQMFAAHGIDFAQYLPPAIVVMWVTFTAISAAVLFARDRRTGMLARLRSMPVNSGAVVAGRLASDGVRGLISICAVIAAAHVTGFRFATGVAGAAAFVLLALTVLLVLSVGTGAAGLASTEPEAVGATLHMPAMPLLMLSTAFAPVGGFPSWLRPVVEYSPVSAVVDALRAVAEGTDLAPLGRAAAWLLVLLVVFSRAATRAYRRAT